MSRNNKKRYLESLIATPTRPVTSVIGQVNGKEWMFTSADKNDEYLNVTRFFKE